MLEVKKTLSETTPGRTVHRIQSDAGIVERRAFVLPGA